MSSPDPSQVIETLVRARYPILAVASHEEDRVERVLLEVAGRRKKSLTCWTVTRGLHRAGTSVQSQKLVSRETTDPVQALEEVVAIVEPTIFLFKDFHPYLGQPEVIRKLRDVAEHLRASTKTLVMVSPHIRVPLELEKDVTIVDFPLPGMKDLERLLGDVVRQVNDSTTLKLDPQAIAVEPIVRASLGLTLKEAENVFAKALVMGGRLTESDIPLILEEKRQVVRRSGLLEFYPADASFDQVGGLEHLKTWLRTRRLGFTEKARQYGLPFPKGALLLGVQGCGKSLCAKAVSASWQIPLLRFDVGRVFASAVGSSEQNVREAIRAAESVAPAVLWVDEIEKAFAGVHSSSFSDGGTTARVFATFLTWLQEKESPVFVIATANSVTSLPPELLRKGRLDEIFFVDLPTSRERRDVLAIHLAKRGRDPHSLPLEELSLRCEGFSGAEIEQAVVSALFESFETDAPMSNESLQRAFRETVPLSRTMAEQVEELRRWASGRARPASLPEGAGESAPSRRMEL